MERAGFVNGCLITQTFQLEVSCNWPNQNPIKYLLIKWNNFTWGIPVSLRTSNQLKNSFVNELHWFLLITTKSRLLIVIQTSAIFCWSYFICRCSHVTYTHSGMGNRLSFNELKHLTLHILCDQLSVSCQNYTWQVNSCTSDMNSAFKQCICHCKCIFISVSPFLSVKGLQL